MEQVQCFKSSDGEIFSTEGECRSHEQALAFDVAIEKDNRYYNDDAGFTAISSYDQFRSFIASNMDLTKALMAEFNNVQTHS
jgi:hypothetical protein